MNVTKKVALLALFTVFALNVQAQTADEIINKYLTNIGGKEKLAALKSVRMTGKGNQQGQEFPMLFINAEGGKQKTSFTFQGKEIVQPAFDGNEGWNTNFMTMKAEKMDAEQSENMKREIGDFPDPFLDYAKKGYAIALEGKETVEGTECFKIKLTKKPMQVEGKEVENVVYYFFDTENFVPLVMRTTIKVGPAKGAVAETVFSDYQEAGGLMFPFSISQKRNGQVGFTIVVDKVEPNVAVDDKLFAFPTGN